MTREEQSGFSSDCLVGLYKVDRKSTRLNSSHQIISYAVFCLKKKKTYKYAAQSGNVQAGRLDGVHGNNRTGLVTVMDARNLRSSRTPVSTHLAVTGANTSLES